MQRSLDLYLKDILKAGEAIQTYVSAETLATYLEHDMVRSAVERQLTIIGEALSKAGQFYPDQVHQRISQEREIVAFRHRVIHGYFAVDDEIVWSVIQTYLPRLLAEVKALLSELPK